MATGATLLTILEMEEVREGHTTKKQPRWDKFDTQRFASLISDGEITPTENSKQYIDRIRQQYWPQREYYNFASNYRRVIRRWQVHRDQRECYCFVSFWFAEFELTRCVASLLKAQSPD